jgi:hypothetical protein
MLPEKQFSTFFFLEIGLEKLVKFTFMNKLFFCYYVKSKRSSPKSKKNPFGKEFSKNKGVVS